MSAYSNFNIDECRRYVKSLAAFLRALSSEPFFVCTSRDQNLNLRPTGCWCGTIVCAAEFGGRDLQLGADGWHKNNNETRTARIQCASARFSCSPCLCFWDGERSPRRLTGESARFRRSARTASRKRPRSL